jgi:hypothetical protein
MGSGPVSLQPIVILPNPVLPAAPTPSAQHPTLLQRFLLTSVDEGRFTRVAESEYYQPVKAYLESLLKDKGATFHLEITARRQFSNTLKAHVGQHRDIVFHFLREAAPDIAGFIKADYSTEFLVVEVKERQLKLDDIYQARKYAELLDARYALLVSPVEIPEEIRRLSKVVYSLLSLPAYKTLTLARFDSNSNTIVDWFPRSPFEPP